MTDVTPTLYRPKPDEQKARFKVYDRLDKMRQLKEQTFPHFAGPEGPRSFMAYIDDSERILNGYTLPRAAQDKEEWQSNMLDNITRAKLRAIVSGVGLKVPEMHFQAVNQNGVPSVKHATIFKCLTKHTFLDGNPVLHSFLETWQMLSHGALFEYEGYKTGGAKQKVIKSFDSTTGEVDFKEEYVKGNAKPFSAIINPQEFLWWDMFIRDIQDQPRIAWEQPYNKMELEAEFSKFPNYKYVLSKKEMNSAPMLRETLYFTKWSTRLDNEEGYLVSKVYDKEDDTYEIWCNGIPLLRAPLVWGDKEKYYPFAKAIAEPFANTEFFVGLSLAGILEHYQDAKNTIINTMIDKLYRSMEVPMLVGLQNKDLLDWESEFINQDNRYYVPDVNQVKPMPLQGINQGELAMLSVIDKGLEGLSIDRSQQGQAPTTQRTARDAVIADRNAQQLKSMLYMFLEDLWLQKTRLRTKNILTHYLKDKASQKQVRDQIVSIANYEFPDGSTGTLDMHIAKNKSSLMPLNDVMAREHAAESQGQVYKIISFTADYIDTYTLDFQIVAESFHNQDVTRREDDFNSEVQWVATIYPEFLVSNKDKYLTEKLAFRGKTMQDYNPPAPPPPPLGPPGAPAPGGQPGAAPTQPTPQPQGQPSPVLGLT